MSTYSDIFKDFIKTLDPVDRDKLTLATTDLNTQQIFVHTHTHGRNELTDRFSNWLDEHHKPILVGVMINEIKKQKAKDRAALSVKNVLDSKDRQI